MAFWTRVEDVRALRLRASGLSLVKCGAAMGRSANSVERRLARLKRGPLPYNPPNKAPPSAPDAMRRYWGREKEADVTFQERLRAAGCREHTVTEPGTAFPRSHRISPLIATKSVLG